MLAHIADCLSMFGVTFFETCESMINALHTTNELAALQMQHLFSIAKWRPERVTPYDGESWIGEVWIRKVRATIVENVSDRRTVAGGCIKHGARGSAALAANFVRQTGIFISGPCRTHRADGEERIRKNIAEV